MNEQYLLNLIDRWFDLWDSLELARIKSGHGSIEAIKFENEIDKLDIAINRLRGIK